MSSEIKSDAEYFENRQIELKHPLFVKQWMDYFRPLSVMDLGCGRGCYLFFWAWFVPYIRGIELSQWAIDNAFVPKQILRQGTITDKNIYEGFHYDLITAVDVLEHLSDSELSQALSGMAEFGRKFLFSIPFIGDPNLELDKTHKQFKTKEQWITMIESHGIRVKETPAWWLYSHQILVGEKT